MSGVDLDRLADYAAGLLEPADAAQVEELLARDPEWARTLAALTSAQPLVQEALAGLGAPPVPDDLAARLDAALSTAADRPADVVSLDERRDKARSRGLRWQRAAAAVASVAAVAALCVGGVKLIGNSGTVNSSSSGVGSAAGVKAPSVPLMGSPPMILSSGTDYTAATVTSVLRERGFAANGAQPQPDQAKSRPRDLSRLDSQADLQACLGLLTTVYNRAPTLVDYAKYQGQPALVVVLDGAAGTKIVVVGAKCGLAGVGTDQIYATPGP